MVRIDVEFQFRTVEREVLKLWRDEEPRFARSKLRPVLLAVTLWVAASLSVSDLRFSPANGSLFTFIHGRDAFVLRQVEAPVVLRIAPSATNVILSWPSPSTGFGLQQSPNLAPANWTNVPQIPSDDGTNKTVMVSASSGNMFYRLASSVQNQIRLVQHASNFGHDVGSLSTAFSSPNAVGNLLVVAHAGGSALTVRDSLGNTYNAAINNFVGSGNSGHLYIWYAINSKAGANTVTVSSSGDCDMQIYEVSGANALDQVATSSGVGGIPSVSSSTTTRANEWVLAFLFDWNNAVNFTAASGYTLEENTHNVAAFQSTGGEDKTITVAAAQTASMTAVGGSDAWMFGLVTFKASSAAGTNWYVSNSGNDNNPGTDVAAPLQHIQTAVNRAAYGDTVNIQAGTYREQVEIDSIGGTGSAANMLTVQAWDTNGDGLIEPNEMPVLNPFQLITNNWWPLANGPLWSNLTGGMAFESGAIYWTPWAPQSTKDEPFELVIASPTNVLQQTSWPQGQKAGVWPSSQPTNMFPGSFRYDYAQHVLFVWRGDGNAPGPEYPIEAPLISTNLPSWGDAGPWVSYPGYVHLRGLVLRFCNAGADEFNLNGRAWPDVAAVGGPSNVVEQCDIEWGVWQGLSAAGNGTIITNCVIANHGMLGLSTGTTNNQVLGNFFFNNGWRHYAGDVTEGACWLGGNCADITLAGNVFSNNWESAIHCDTVTTPLDRPIRILNNFILATNALPEKYTGAGIEMEVASSAWIINNVIVTSGNPAIYLGGSHWNRVLFNTCFANFNPVTPASCLILFADIGRDTDGITLHTYDAAFNLLAYNIFAGYGDEALVGALQDSSAGATSLGAICYSNTYIGNIIFNIGSQFRTQMNVGLPPYTQGPLAYFNDAAGWSSSVCGGNPGCSNSANIVTNPLFVAANAVNFSTATAFMLATNSPAGGYAPTNYNVPFDFAGNPRKPGSTAAGAFDNVTTP